MFKVKADHTLKRLVVVQGWGQITGVNCGCTNAPVCRIQSIRMALAIAAHEDWEVLPHQTSILNARVQDGVYGTTPHGYGSVDVST